MAALLPPKLTPPRQYGVVERARLLELLEPSSGRPIAWIAAAPGAGKTTLAASYLARCKGAKGWYQVDHQDEDPAHLFQNLAILVRGLSKRAAALPDFRPEYAPEVTRFAARFATAALEALPEKTTLVFDNFQEAASSPFLDVMHALLEAWSARVRLVVASRGELPAALAALRARKLVANILPADLAFDVAETAELMDRAKPTGEVAATVHRMTGGWAAGIVLATEYLGEKADPASALRAATRDAFLGYFASEVVSSLPEESRELLLAAAHFPWFTTAMVDELAARKGAAPLLADLQRRHFFTDAREEGVYVFHALFREFLLTQAEQSWDATRLAAMRIAAARILERAGEADAAIGWLKRAHAWDEALASIRNALPEALSRLRYDTVVAWVEGIPAAKARADAHLALRVGEAHLELGRYDASRPWLEAAAEGLRASGERAWEALALAQLADATYQSGHDYREAVATQERLLPLVDEAQRLPVAERIIVCRAAFELCTVGLIPLPDAMRFAKFLWPVVEGEEDANHVVAAATALLRYYSQINEQHTCDNLLRLERLVRDPSVTPLTRIDWMGIAGYYLCWQGGAEAQGLALLDEGERLAGDYGLEGTGAFLQMLHDRIEGLSYARDLAGMRRALDKLSRVTPPGKRQQWAYYHYFEACYAMLALDYGRADEEFRRAITLAHETSLPKQQSRTFLAKHCFALIALGHWDDAHETTRVILQDRALIFPTTLAMIESRDEGIDLVRALREGAEDIDARLEHWLATMPEPLRYTFWIWIDPVVVAILAEALRRGIQVDYAREVIRRRGFAAPADAPESWPWAVRVRAFGGFALEVDGKPVLSQGKAQKKPLELLKALAAQGGEADVAFLCGALWPDAEGDDARASFDVTLMRLRKLVGRDDVVVLADGRLRLSTGRAWLDTRAFEAATDRGDAPALLALYRGDLLAGEPEEPWFLGARERLRERFLRAAEAAAEKVRAARGEGPEVRQLYERVLEVEPLAESIYRRLMRHHHETGSAADAIRVYRRCRQMLSVMLGIAPSAETEALMKRIHAGAET